jgi:hypothetical protein
MPLEFCVSPDFVVHGMAWDLVGRYLRDHGVFTDHGVELHFAPEARSRDGRAS